MPGSNHNSANSASSSQPNHKPYKLEELSRDSAARTVTAAQKLLLEYGRFVAAQPGIASFCYGDLEQEAAALPHSYLDQQGGSMVAWVNAEPAGFIAWRSLPGDGLADAWELKRLWIRPAARGLGVGRALVQAVLDGARKARKSQVVLDTAPDSMAAAHRLYQEMGFHPCPPYGGAPSAGIVYMRREVVG